MWTDKWFLRNILSYGDGARLNGSKFKKKKKQLQGAHKSLHLPWITCHLCHCYISHMRSPKWSLNIQIQNALFIPKGQFRFYSPPPHTQSYSTARQTEGALYTAHGEEKAPFCFLYGPPPTDSKRGSIRADFQVFQIRLIQVIGKMH